MSRNVEVFERTLARLKIKEPLAESLQAGMDRYKRESLTGVLKQFGGYGVLYAAVLTLYRLLRKTGVNISLVQGKIIIGIMISIAGFSATAGLYKAIEYVIRVQSTPEIKQKKKSETNDTTGLSTPSSIDMPVLIGAMKFIPFTSETVNRGILATINRSIVTNLRAMGTKKNGGALPVSNGTARYLFIGSAERVGKTLVITARLVDAVSASVVQSSSETSSYDGAAEAGARLAAAFGEYL